MVVLSCAYSAYPAYSAYSTHAVSLRAHRGFSPEPLTSPVSVSLTRHHRHHHHDHPFVPEAMDTKDAGGHEALDQAFAEIVGAESAIVRSQFFSGTHDIKCALFAFLDNPSHHKAIEPVIESRSKTRLQLQPQPQLRRPAEVVEDN